jgi:hypothetical protein
MVRAFSLRILAAALTVLATAQTPPPPPNSYVGVQGLVIIGQHQDIAGTQKGVGAGPLLQLRAGGRRLVRSLEGIPVVGIPGVPPSETYGQATPHVGIFNGQLEYALTAQRSLWLGIGETVYNQRTPLPAQNQVVSSRLAGVRYAARYVRATSASHFIEAFVGAAPMLTGSDVYVATGGALLETKPERASEIDASLSFGVRVRSNEWIVGVRSLNFAAEFTNTGEAADRNVGIGPLIEWRHILP